MIKLLPFLLLTLPSLLWAGSEKTNCNPTTKVSYKNFAFSDSELETKVKAAKEGCVLTKNFPEDDPFCNYKDEELNSLQLSFNWHHKTNCLQSISLFLGDYSKEAYEKVFKLLTKKYKLVRKHTEEDMENARKEKTDEALDLFEEGNIELLMPYRPNKKSFSMFIIFRSNDNRDKVSKDRQDPVKPASQK